MVMMVVVMMKKVIVIIFMPSTPRQGDHLAKIVFQSQQAGVVLMFW